jgi:Peroxisomal membrane protein (Pex16)
MVSTMMLTAAQSCRAAWKLYSLQIDSIQSCYSLYLSHHHPVLAIFKFGRYSWRPWLISLAVESASQAAVSRSFTSPYGSTKSTMTALETAELSRRYHQMWFNMLRGRFYEQFTR